MAAWERPIQLDEGYTREKRDEIRALIQSAKIFCKQLGLGTSNGLGVVSNTLETLRKYFPESSAASKTCSLLLQVALIDPDAFKGNYDDFSPDDVIAALDVLEEALGLKQLK